MPRAERQQKRAAKKVKRQERRAETGGTRVGNLVRKVKTKVDKVKKSNLGQIVTSGAKFVKSVKSGNIKGAITSGKNLVTTGKKIIKKKKRNT